MRKGMINVFAFGILILGCGAVIGGCGKKHEKIALESTEKHVEATMEASTEASSEAPEITTAPETTAPDESSDASNGASVQDVVKPNAVTHTTASYTSGKVSVQYPVMEHLEESQSAVNDLIRLNALSAVNAYVTNPETDALEVKCRVLAADKSRITIVYTGTAMAAGAAYPVNVLYSSTIDVRNVSNLDLPSMADPRTLAEYVMSAECVYSGEFGDWAAAGGEAVGAGSAGGELAEALAQIHSDRGADWYTRLFSAADFPAAADAFPSCFSFEKDGDIYFSIPVPHALGDYVVAVFTPENK